MSQGTYHVSITFEIAKGHPTGADTMTVKTWPGTAEGHTPPANIGEALTAAATWCVSIMENASKDLGIERVREIRVTTFEQGSAADPLVERDDEQYCDVCGEDLNDGRDVEAFHKECSGKRRR